MSIGLVIAVLGGVVAVLGLVTQGVAGACMASYRLRRAMPFQSPFQLLDYGKSALFAGMLLIFLGLFLLGAFE